MCQEVASPCLSITRPDTYRVNSASDGVKLWDLRKLKNFKTLTPYDSAATSCCAFDYSGQWLAVGGADARVYAVKQVRFIFGFACSLLLHKTESGMLSVMAAEVCAPAHCLPLGYVDTPTCQSGLASGEDPARPAQQGCVIAGLG